MYSEDSEDNFKTLDRKQQEELLKKTWMDREREFYGEELDSNEDVIEEQQEEEEEDQSSDEEELKRDHADQEDLLEEKPIDDQYDQYHKSIRQSTQNQATLASQVDKNHFASMQKKQLELMELQRQLKEK